MIVVVLIAFLCTETFGSTFEICGDLTGCHRSITGGTEMRNFIFDIEINLLSVIARRGHMGGPDLLFPSIVWPAIQYGQLRYGR